MSASQVCKVCGKPLAVHHLMLYWGIAQAAIYDDRGRSRPCSQIAAEYLHIEGRIQTLITIVRSLRWHAGRLRTKDANWRADDLDRQADKFERQIATIERNTGEHYAWAKEAK